MQQIKVEMGLWRRVSLDVMTRPHEMNQEEGLENSKHNWTDAGKWERRVLKVRNGLCLDRLWILLKKTAFIQHMGLITTSDECFLVYQSQRKPKDNNLHPYMMTVWDFTRIKNLSCVTRLMGIENTLKLKSCLVECTGSKENVWGYCKATKTSWGAINRRAVNHRFGLK